MSFLNISVLKKPSRNVASVLNVFTKAIDDLKAVIADHSAHAEAQLKVADAATAAAAASQAEAELAQTHIDGLEAVLYPNTAPAYRSVDADPVKPE